jgi:hypothetical protein
MSSKATRLVCMYTCTTPRTSRLASFAACLLKAQLPLLHQRRARSPAPVALIEAVLELGIWLRALESVWRRSVRRTSSQPFMPASTGSLSGELGLGGAEEEGAGGDMAAASASSLSQLQWQTLARQQQRLSRCEDKRARLCACPSCLAAAAALKFHQTPNNISPARARAPSPVLSARAPRRVPAPPPRPRRPPRPRAHHGSVIAALRLPREFRPPPLPPRLPAPPPAALPWRRTRRASRSPRAATS